MLVRIVKMSFEAGKVPEFLDNFNIHKKKIRSFQGCTLLELYRDKSESNIFFTYSYWETENDLNNYRHSDFFKSVWSETKTMFSKKPEAWSVDKVVSLR